MSKLNPFINKIPIDKFYQNSLLNTLKYQLSNIKQIEADVSQSLLDSYELLKKYNDYDEDNHYMIVYSFPKLNCIQNLFSLEIKSYTTDCFLTNNGTHIGCLDISWFEMLLGNVKKDVTDFIYPKGALINKSLVDYVLLDQFDNNLNLLIKIFSETLKKYSQEKNCNISDKIIFAFEKNKNTIVRL